RHSGRLTPSGGEKSTSESIINSSCIRQSRNNRASRFPIDYHCKPQRSIRPEKPRQSQVLSYAVRNCRGVSVENFLLPVRIFALQFPAIGSCPRPPWPGNTGEVSAARCLPQEVARCIGPTPAQPQTYPHRRTWRARFGG